MQTANEQLQLFASLHSIFLERFKAGTVRKIIGLLNRMDADIVRQLSDNLEQAGTNRLRLEIMLNQIRMVNNSIATRIQAELEGELRPFAAREIEAQAESIHKAIKVDLAIYAPAPQQLYTAALAEPFAGGRMLSEWIESFSAARQARIRDAIRMGFASGESIPRIVERVRGTRANQYRDGVMETSRRDLRTIVRSSVAHLAAEAREATFKANGHLIKEEIWSSSLDGRTSEWCIPRSQLRYTFPDHEPIGHNFPWGAGPGNIHPNCRSVGLPVTRSFREMNLDIDEPQPGSRPFVALEPIRDDQGRIIPLPKPASKMSVAEYTQALKRAGKSPDQIRDIKSRLIGQVPAETDYEKFLKSRPRGFTEEVLGKSKAKLFLDGGVPLRDLYKTDGDELTLDELRRKERKAWKEAGLDG